MSIVHYRSDVSFIFINVSMGLKTVLINKRVKTESKTLWQCKSPCYKIDDYISYAADL